MITREAPPGWVQVACTQYCARSTGIHDAATLGEADGSTRWTRSVDWTRHGCTVWWSDGSRLTRLKSNPTSGPGPGAGDVRTEPGAVPGDGPTTPSRRTIASGPVSEPAAL